MTNIVDSIGYKKGSVSPPYFVVIHVKFINFLFFPLEILGCKIYLPNNDNTQINCMGKNSHIEPKELEIRDNDKNIKPAKMNSIDLPIYISGVVMQSIKESAANNSKVQYCIHIKWRLKSEYFDEYVFNDYISFKGVPDFNTA